MPRAVSYQEPSLLHLLVLASFLYLTNVARIVADHYLYAGIVAEIAFGIIYGSPLGNLLPVDWEATFTALGYLGLILVVFEGGLSTNLPVLLSNLPLSVLCALVGIALPIAFSFALLSAGFGYRPLEAFAAGAALSSTSLGTTLAALNSVTKSGNIPEKCQPRVPARQSVDESIPMVRSKLPPPAAASTPTLPPEPSSLQQSRIGTVLISAAIIDDVVGLVIASLIPALAAIESSSTGGGQGNLAWTIVRPLLSSSLIAVVGSVIARFVLRPLFWYCGAGERWCALAREGKPWGFQTLLLEGGGWGTEAHADAAKLLIMVAVVSAMAAITSYTGTSVLYGAYVAGLILTYVSQPTASHGCLEGSLASLEGEDAERRAKALSFEDAFARTVGPLQNYLLLPLFFASIGFAIPFLDLWTPTVLWRGIVYSVLMCLAKLAVGLPILFYPATHAFASSIPSRVRTLLTSTRPGFRNICASVRRKPIHPRADIAQDNVLPHADAETKPEPGRVSPYNAPTSSPPTRAVCSLTTTITSLPAAVFMGVAMVSRGEIGLLIAQLARGGTEGSSSAEPTSRTGSGLLGDEAFLVAIWAILLCTLVGPISVGLVVRRWGSRVTAGIWA